MIYFIRDTASGSIKIGHSAAPWARLSQVQTASPNELVMIGLEPGGEERERELHQIFAAGRLRGEWFAASAILLDHIAKHPVPKRASPVQDFWNGRKAKDVAAEIGVSASMLSHIYTGRRRASPEVAVKLQEATGISAIKLVFGELAERAA